MKREEIQEQLFNELKAAAENCTNFLQNPAPINELMEGYFDSRNLMEEAFRKVWNGLSSLKEV